MAAGPHLEESNRSAWFIREASVVLTELGESVERDVAEPAQAPITAKLL